MKKIRHHRLDIEHRPTFGPMNAIHKTNKDKENTRQNQKIKIKKQMEEYDEI